jgi:transposase
MQLVNKSVDKVRRKQQKLLDGQGYKIFKGNRFLLLSNYEDLSKDKQERLNKMLFANEPLLIMHVMKEHLRLLWSKKTRKKGQKFLGVWIMEAFFKI